MFYSAQILARKGPLGVVWIAAHMDSRLKRNQVFETNLPGSIDSILNPEAPLALRLSGQLLLGVVKIYQKKVIYLVQDCNQALVKMKQAFKPGEIDLADEGARAPLNVITLPDNYNDIDSLGGHTSFTLEPYDPSKPAPFTLSNSRENYLLTDDGHTIYTPISYNDERFEAHGEEMERELSMGPAERLRDASVASERQPLFQLQDNYGSPGFVDGNEKLAVPSEEDLQDLLQPPPSAPPSSRPASDDPMGDLTPVDMGGGFLDADLPDVAPLDMEIRTPADDAGVSQEAAGPSAAKRTPVHARQQAAGGRRKRARVDVQGDKPATHLNSADIRALIQDRAPLLRKRGGFTLAQLLSQRPLDELDIVKQNEGSKDSLLERPALGDRMAPALYAVYLRSMTNGPRSQANRKRKSKTSEDVTEADAEQPASPGRDALDALDNTHDDADDTNLPLTEGDMDLPLLETDGPDLYDAQDDIRSSPGTFGDADGHAGSGFSSPASNGVARESRRPTSARKRQGTDLDSEGEGEESNNARGSFTVRTQQVLKQVKAKLKGQTGAAQSGKKQRLAGAAAEHVGFQELDGDRNRTESARLFFDLLVLQSRKQVLLSQAEPYAEIHIQLHH